MSTVLQFDDVRLSFGAVTAVNGISFEVQEDELFAVIGPNGAGKTSIFNVISGVYRPQRGSVELDGRNLLGLAPHKVARRGVARTFQNIELFANLTVIDNLMLGRHQHIGYEAATSLEGVDSEGTLPEGTGNYAAEPNEQAVRVTQLNAVDPSAQSKLKVAVEPFVGPTAENHEFSETPCYEQK